MADDKYAFNVSYTGGDNIISMGKVFIIQTPKDSISSKYRGYELVPLTTTGVTEDKSTNSTNASSSTNNKEPNQIHEVFTIKQESQ